VDAALLTGHQLPLVADLIVLMMQYCLPARIEIIKLQSKELKGDQYPIQGASNSTASIHWSKPIQLTLNSRPPAPWYFSTWILSYFCSLPDNSKLSFQAFSHKLAMLMALSNADRFLELAALNLNFRHFQSNGVLFVIPQSRRNGLPLEAFYPEFTANLNCAHFRP